MKTAIGTRQDHSTKKQIVQSNSSMEIIDIKDVEFEWTLPQWFIDEMDYKKNLIVEHGPRKGKKAYETSPHFEVCEEGAKALNICGFREGKDEYKEDAVNDDFGICDFVRRGKKGCMIGKHKYGLCRDGNVDGLLVWDWVGGYPQQMFAEFNTKNGKGWKAGDVSHMKLIQFIPRQRVLDKIKEEGGFRNGMYITSFI